MTDIIVKEYCQDTDTVVLRRCDYSHSVKAIHELITEAENDFPFEDDAIDKISIIIYGGERYKRTWGIEFLNPLIITPPQGLYRRIVRLEQRL